MNKKTLFLTQGAMIAALYVVLTVFVAAFNLASGAVQVRISEALTIMPVFTPAAIPGLFLGCLISNIIAGGAIIDILFGSLTTLVAAVCTYFLRKTKVLYMVPPVLFNAIVIPFVLMFAYGSDDAYWFMFATVGAGELISVFIFGFILKKAIDPIKNKLMFAE